ncbi:MAG: sulfurtransferase [Myxococcota bacterium]|nr:sulfurtransferase [Myxococcota bacterium]
MSGALPLLVDGAWLEARLGNPSLRVIDASWYLASEKRDARAEYRAAHIPNAVYLDLSVDLADPDAPVRNTLAAPDALAGRLGSAGISNAHDVVIYDRKAGYSAGRIWWILRYLGHRRAALLDGGFERWCAEGRRQSREAVTLEAHDFVAAPEPAWLSSSADVASSLEREEVRILDARSSERFRGEGPEPARHAGHIPGARNLPWSDNLHGDPGCFRPIPELRKLYEDAGVRFDAPVITTCGSGVTAALEAFLLTLAGHPEVSVYDGSWAEWGNADGFPIETGPAR